MIELLVQLVVRVFRVLDDVMTILPSSPRCVLFCTFDSHPNTADHASKSQAISPTDLHLACAVSLIANPCRPMGESREFCCVSCGAKRAD